MKNQTISTAKDILSSISDMKSSSQKAWLTKNINQHTEYIRTIEDKFYNRKWKHYYGEPLNEEVIRFEVDQLRELMNARAFLNGEKIEKVADKPVAKQKSEAPKPTAQTATELALVELTRSVTNLTGQLGELTKIVTQNSKDIAALQSTINLTNRWLPQQPKVEKQTKTTKTTKTAKPKAVASAPAKVVEDKSIQPKKTTKSLLEELFGSFRTVKADKPKAEKSDRKEYNPYGTGYKANKMARMEVR
jgi:Tfp pilus assembly protein FimV